MAWVVVGLAIAVLGLFALVGSGRLGEMPPPEDETYGGRIPDGELNEHALAVLRFPLARKGYDIHEVDDFVRSVRDGGPDGEAPSFRVVKRGYRRREVDGVLDRIAWMRNNRGASPQESSGHEEAREHNGSDEATDG